MAECPVCGMETDERTAVTAEIEDEIYYFCSRSCRDSFLADQETFEEYDDECDEEYDEEYDDIFDVGADDEYDDDEEDGR